MSGSRYHGFGTQALLYLTEIHSSSAILLYEMISTRGNALIADIEGKPPGISVEMVGIYFLKLF
jgi:hypothetical protein